MPLLTRTFVPTFVVAALRQRVDAGATVQTLAGELGVQEESLLRALAGMPSTTKTRVALIEWWIQSSGLARDIEMLTMAWAVVRDRESGIISDADVARFVDKVHEAAE